MVVKEAREAKLVTAAKVVTAVTERLVVASIPMEPMVVMELWGGLVAKVESVGTLSKEMTYT
jgi:hypothetical protein